MDNLPTWLLPFWIIGAPMLVLILDYMRTSTRSRAYAESAAAQPSTTTMVAGESNYERP